MLRRVKLIAEPWDIGLGGYQLGGFPPGWSEWNDQFRDTVRGFWRGDAGQLPELPRASPARARSSRPPAAAARQHQLRRRAMTATRSPTSSPTRRSTTTPTARTTATATATTSRCNYGVEGPTDDPAILALRARQKRNMLATLFLAQGVPMLLMGDERARTQGGNNNAYCQDNATSWMDWARDPDPDLALFVANLTRLRREQPALRRRDFLDGARIDPDAPLRDVHWLAPGGGEMDDSDWGDAERRCLGMQIGNEACRAARASSSSSTPARRPATSPSAR